MESKLRLGKLSLTRRLTLFFTVVAAAVVLGLGAFLGFLSLLGFSLRGGLFPGGRSWGGE